MTPPFRRVHRTAWRPGSAAEGERAIPEESAVAFTYNGTSYAVMMATPQDLEDFALGFSLTEAIVASLEEIERLDVVEEEIGIELRMWLAPPRAAGLAARRRHLAGPTGCGLCGIESLAEAMRPPPHVGDGFSLAPREVQQAIDAVAPLQTLNHETRAVHAAAFWQPAVLPHSTLFPRFSSSVAMPRIAQLFILPWRPGGGARRRCQGWPSR